MGTQNYNYEIPAKDAKPESNHEEHQTNQNEGHSTKQLPCNLLYYKGHASQGKTLFQTEEIKRQQLNAMHDLGKDHFC